MSVTTVMLVGVGGQGTILAADVLAKVAVKAGLDVKLAEVHGMSQRGGSVDTVVRFGERVFSPTVDAGVADHLVAFEITEAARWLHFCAPDGRLIVNRRIIAPLSVVSGEASTVGLEAALIADEAVYVDADDLACRAGSPRSANIVLLGALSTGLHFDADLWHEVISDRVPARTIEANLAAFDLGRSTGGRGECA